MPNVQELTEALWSSLPKGEYWASPNTRLEALLTIVAEEFGLLGAFREEVMRQGWEIETDEYADLWEVFLGLDRYGNDDPVLLKVLTLAYRLFYTKYLSFEEMNEIVEDLNLGVNLDVLSVSPAFCGAGECGSAICGVASFEIAIYVEDPNDYVTQLVIKVIRRYVPPHVPHQVLSKDATLDESLGL